MLSELSQEIELFTEGSKQYIPTMLLVMAVLWGINLLNWSTGKHLNRFGIIPRRPRGLVGIALAPILHADFNHLLFNSMPLFFLGVFIMTMDRHLFYVATILITILAGLGVWLVGRDYTHIGASALIAGYFGFVLAFAYQAPSITTLFCAAIAMYYFGGILFSLFPTQEKVSWEGHLIGFLSGLLTMYLCVNYWHLFVN